MVIWCFILAGLICLLEPSPEKSNSPPSVHINYITPEPYQEQAYLITHKPSTLELTILKAGSGEKIKTPYGEVSSSVVR